MIKYVFHEIAEAAAEVGEVGVPRPPLFQSSTCRYCTVMHGNIRCCMLLLWTPGRPAVRGIHSLATDKPYDYHCMVLNCMVLQWQTGCPAVPRHPLSCTVKPYDYHCYGTTASNGSISSVSKLPARQAPNQKIVQVVILVQ